MSVHDITEAKPHFAIDGINAVHIIPVETMQMVADRDMTFDEIEEWQDMLPTIIHEWLEAKLLELKNGD